MIAPIKLSRLGALASIADGNGRPTPLFIRYFNDLLGKVETAFNGIIDALNRADAAQDQADTATDNAATAQQTADSKISQADADALYVHQDSTPAWEQATGTLDRSAFTVYAAPLVSDPPTQAEVQGVADALQVHSQHLAALIADLTTANVLSE
jgi:hypothetical protein